MTGLTFMAAEFNGKRLELLREFIPGLRRVAIVANPEHPGEEIERRDSEDAGKRLAWSPNFLPREIQKNSTMPLRKFRQRRCRRFPSLRMDLPFKIVKKLSSLRWAAVCR